MPSGTWPDPGVGHATVERTAKGTPSPSSCRTYASISSRFLGSVATRARTVLRLKLSTVDPDVASYPTFHRGNRGTAV